MFENQQILAVNSHAEVHHFEVPNISSLVDGFAEFEAVLRSQQLPLPQVLASAYDQGQLRAMYTSDSEHLAAIKRAIETSNRLKVHRPPLSSVTLTCYGSVATDLDLRVARALQTEKISIEKTLQSPMSLTLLVSPEKREKAIQTLHKMVGST